MEVVDLRDGDAVTLGVPVRLGVPRRGISADDEVILTPTTATTTTGLRSRYRPRIGSGGMTDGPETVVRVILKSWMHPLDAEPGPALIELNLGTAGERTDLCAEITPAEARAVAQALLNLAATAERAGDGRC